MAICAGYQGLLHAGLLTKPFVLCNSNEAVAVDALNQLLAACLGGKQSHHLPGMLADIIAAVATATDNATRSAIDRQAFTATGHEASLEAKAGAAADAGAAYEGLRKAPVQATAAAAAAAVGSQAASEAVVSMLAAVADKLSPDTNGRVQDAGRRQQTARSKDAQMDLTRQHESAGHVMLAYASKGPEEQKMVLGLHFYQVRVPL